MPAAPGLFWFLHTPRTVAWVHRYLWLGFALGAVGVMALGALAGKGSTPVGWVVVGAVGYVGLVAGFAFFHPSRLFTPLRNVLHVSADEIGETIDPDEEVLGLVTETGGPRAYTMSTLIQPHGAWDTLDEQPRFVTWCSLSGSGAALDLEVRPGVLADFTSITALEDNIVFHDRRTGNYVQQLGERVIFGPDRGLRLGFVPVWRTTWGAWRRWHPDTRVCHQPSRFPLDRVIRSAMLKVHQGLPARSTPQYPVRSTLDPRLGAMEPVLGVEHGGQARAYPLGSLARAGEDRVVLSQEMGDEPTVILASARDRIGGAFSRRVGGRELSFEPAPGKDGVARDRETGSLWAPTGRAVAGPRAGALLQPLRFYWGVFWFRWSISHPETELVEELP